MSRIVVMGPPGVGKGTQAAVLSTRLDVVHIPTGQMFRDEIASGSELGRTLAHVVSAGDYVSDALTSELLRARFRAHDARSGFILDGFPRTVAQVAVLDAMLGASGQAVNSVLLFEAPSATLLARIAGRASAGRNDDNEDTARHRLHLYNTATAPVVAVYEKRGILHRIDASGSREEVATLIADHLGI